jgi:threonylcarbamoyladenosine tRNA methylthiotransferase MtaB
MEPRFTYAIKTLGCKANIYDSLIIENELKSIGGERLISKAHEADVFIVNSCTVTAEADKQSLREITQQKKRTPSSITVMTGCYAEVASDILKQQSSIDLVVPNGMKGTIAQQVSKQLFPEEIITKSNDTHNDHQEIFWGQLPVGSAGRTRGFLKIQEGCNDFCTYCIIPYARGNSRSVRMDAILAEIQRIADLGTKEVVLTGTNIADWGKEWGHTLEDLIQVILEKTNLKRLRLTSLDPSEITPRILELLKSEQRLMPHIHLSLQSAHSRVLRAMKRQYRSEDVVRALTELSKLGREIFVGMDVIAGFPSETKEEHTEALLLLRDLPWHRLHVFPYSAREGTPALKIPGLAPIEERKRRASELTSLSNIRIKAYAESFVGRSLNGILFEEPQTVENTTYLGGHGEQYLRVLAKVDPDLAPRYTKTIGSMRVTGAHATGALDFCLEGEVIC